MCRKMRPAGHGFAILDFGFSIAPGRQFRSKIENLKSKILAALLALVFFVAGCGSAPSKTPAGRPNTLAGAQPERSAAKQENKGEAADDEKTQAAKQLATGVVQGEYYVVDGEEVFARSFSTRVSASPLWNKYFEWREADRTAKKPFLRFGTFSERHADAAGGTISATIEINLTVTDLNTQKRIWTDQAQESTSHHSLNAQFQYEELMKRIPKSEALDHLAERAACLALCLLGKSSLPLVLETFKQHPDYLNPVFLNMLLRQNPKREVELAILAAGLKSSDPNLHNAALDHVLKMQLDSAEAIPILAELLRNPDGSLRARAVENLAKIGGPAAEQLMDALADESVQVYLRAEETLTRLGPGCPEVKAQVPHLVELAGSLKSSQRRLALKVLAQLGREEGQKTFANALLDDEPGLQAAAGEYLKPLGPKNAAILPELKAALIGPNRTSRFVVLDVLKGIGPEACDVLALALQDSGEKVRYNAAVALEQMGEPGVEILIPFAKSEDRYVAGIVKRAMAKYPNAGKKAQAETKKAEAPKPEEKKKATAKQITLRDGRVITAVFFADIDEECHIKSTTGEKIVVKKADVEKIETIQQP